MASPANVNLTTIKRGDTYVVNFFFIDTNGSKDISHVSIDAHAKRTIDGEKWFDLKPVKINASEGHFMIHLTREQTRQITESPPGSFSGIYDIQFTWPGAEEIFVSTIVEGTISISKDITVVGPNGDDLSFGGDGTIPAGSLDVELSGSLNPGDFAYDDKMTVEQITQNRFAISGSIGLGGIDWAVQAAISAAYAKQYKDETKVFRDETEVFRNQASQSKSVAVSAAASASDSAALAASLTELDIFKQYRDESKQYSENSEASSQSSAQFASESLASKEASEAAKNISVQAAEKSVNAANVSELNKQQVTSDKNTVQSLANTVATQSNNVNTKHAEVVSKAQEVSNNTSTVTTSLNEVQTLAGQVASNKTSVDQSVIEVNTAKTTASNAATTASQQATVATQEAGRAKTEADKAASLLDTKVDKDAIGTAASRDVMTSPTDRETPNALMPRGAFGFAVSPNTNLPYLADFDDTSKLINGASYTANTQTIGDGKPFEGDACVVRVERYGANDAIMFAWRGLRNPNGGVVFRTWSNINGYEKWQRFYHTGNTGTAVTRNVTESAIDTTTGRLLKVADFGLGSVNPAVLEVPTQFGYAPNSTSPGAVLGVEGPFISHSIGSRGFVLSARGVRAAIRTFGEQGDPTMDLYTNRNAVGTVSQTGGVPTGALIQKSVNPNGSFISLFDGTLIMRKTISALGDGTDEIMFTLAFPTVSTTTACLGFSVSVSGTVDIRVAEFRVPFLLAGLNSAIVKFKFNQVVETTGRIEMSFIVIGTWY